MNKAIITARRKRGALLLAWAAAVSTSQNALAGDDEGVQGGSPAIVCRESPTGAGELECIIRGDTSDDTRAGVTYERV